MIIAQHRPNSHKFGMHQLKKSVVSSCEVFHKPEEHMQKSPRKCPILW